MKSPRRLLWFVLSFASLSQVNAEVGNNNPTGVSRTFNGNVTTGCSYDPYTGNAHRTITDIVVAGGVGEYPLALTRTSNSRSPWGNTFGVPGAWRHSYQWVLQNSPDSTAPSFHPIFYSVDFPDGRSMTFTSSGSGPLGVRHRFEPLNLNTMLAYLILPHGGKVEFRATQQSYVNPCWPECQIHYYYYCSYVATAIIDHYGLRTALTYNANGRLNRVTEPAGRYLQFFYRTAPGQTGMIDQVTGSDGRSVKYNYANISPGGQAYTALTSVVYYGNVAWTSRYTYQAPNVGNAGGLPLLSTADDPMYLGPMKRIGYVYKPGNNPDGSAAAYGQILSENYYDGTTIRAAVSTLEITDSTHRKETRGGNKIRTFIYTITGYLTWVSDFMERLLSFHRAR
jgi:YD repeat-containing protein